MAFVRLTRPDDSPVFVNPDDVSRFAPAPAGELAGGTRITFRSGGIQDVKELPAEVDERLRGG